ncbi:hypothetical protein WA158_001887 [Blastocystis sp. Blastoise]
MKSDSLEKVYDYSWDKITTTFWSKYWHPKCAHSRAFVTSRYLDDKNRLVTKRLHVISQDVPSYIRAIVGTPVSYAGEESIVDPQNKTLTMKTLNLSMNCMVTIDELCRYTAHGKNNSLYTKDLKISAHLNRWMDSTIEDWCVSVDAANRFNGFKVMEEIASGVCDSFVESFTPRVSPDLHMA